MKSWPKFSIREKIRSHPYGVVVLMAAALLAMACLSILVGSVSISPGELLSALSSSGDPAHTSILLYVRIPRTIAALMAGSALAVSGVLLQAVLQNALASPNIIGVNAGAGLGALIISTLFPASLGFVPAAAFCGALLSTVIIYTVARRTGISRITLVLAGVAISSLLSAGMDTLITLFPDSAIGANAFLIGGFSGVSWNHLLFALPYIAVGLLLAHLFRYELNVLGLGEDTAASLGLRVGRYRFMLIVTAALLAGSAVSFAGLLGFIGLIVPHAARFLVGPDHRLLVPVSALLGAVFTTGCDLLARILFAPYEIPVGIIMSFLGAPFFIYLILNRKRGRIHD
jgi:iron complex transport system permease protein